MPSKTQVKETDRLQKQETSLQTQIQQMDTEIQTAIDNEDWQSVAALREKRSYLQGPTLRALKEKQSEARLNEQRQEIKDLRQDADKLRQGIEDRDKRTAEARALIENEEGVSFEALRDNEYRVPQKTPHWTNNLKPSDREGDSRSNSERDMEKALELESKAAKLEREMR